MSKNFHNYGGIKIPKNDVVNVLTLNDYIRRLQELAVNTFEWKNLPPEIDVRFLEMTLFSTGMAVFYWEDIVELFVALTVMIGGDLNIYQVPKQRRAYSVNGYQCDLTNKNSVLIFNNYLREPDFPTLELYARKLYDVDRATMTNIHLQRFPLIVKTSESQRLTVENLMKQYEGDKPFILANKNLDIEEIKAISTDVPYVADKLMVAKKQIWNEALNFLGIETVNTDKAERLIVDEVSANLAYTHAQRYVRLNMRRQACEQINKMFDLDIWVDFRTDVNTPLNQTTESPTTISDEREDRENVSLYDPSPMDS